MTVDELRQEIAYDLQNMQRVVDELIALHRDTAGRTPTLREQAAAGAFLASFYNGVENILKRITVFQNQEIPTGAKWHVELFDRFVEPPVLGLPALFDANLAAAMDPYRRFRHFTRTTYGLELDWNRMATGIECAEPTFEQFRNPITRYLDALG